jgi:ATP-dependent Clp protease ATP-binding subunit ClpC
MFEHYSEHAQSVIERARQEAQKLRHDHIGTEHILLGLIEVKDGCAARVLKHRNIDLPHAREQVKKLVTYGSGPEDGNYEKLPFTKHSISAINDALTEARQLKHATVGSEHILLGLLYENEGIAAQVLRNLGFKLEDIRKDVLHFLSKKSEMDND